MRELAFMVKGGTYIWQQVAKSFSAGPDKKVESSISDRLSKAGM